MLEDGAYDALVVDADTHDDGSTRIELTIIAGAHKGEVVAVRAASLARDPIELLGLPAVLTVANGEPSVEIER